MFFLLWLRLFDSEFSTQVSFFKTISQTVVSRGISVANPCVASSQPLLAALNFGAVFAGIATGALTSSLVALALGGLLAILDVDSGPDVGLVTGVLVGLAAAGWVAGRRAVHSHRFHGMVTGLTLAFVVMVVARLGGSPASLATILWLALLSVVVAGFSGWLAGRRQA
jgi:hypothetical protein